MFSIERFELVHWDWWERFSVPLDAGIVTIVGPNGSGKTTLLDALRTALAIDCSAGRDYKRYVRRSDKPYAWLRMVVANTRGARGQLAFWPLTTPQVTLFCRIRKKGGDWERSYGIGGGVVPVESAEESDAVTWIGVKQYAAQLEGAGLTRAIKRVLALDQGHTDKLCEYSGQELLRLVFDVFGDQEVLDNYQKAREEQNGVARELEALNTQLAGLGLRVEEAQAQVRSFHEWMRLSDEATALQAEWVPRLRIAELHDAVRGGRSQVEGLRRELIDRRETLQASAARAVTAKQAFEQADALRAQLDEELGKAQLELAAAGEPERDAQTLCNEKARLIGLLQQRSDGVDLTKLAAEVEQLRQTRAELNGQATRIAQERVDLVAQIAALESGRRPEPAEVAQFREALKRAGIAHQALADIVAVDDLGWQLAVESVLRPHRHILLLDDARDEPTAYALGEQLGYRHFIVPEREPAPAPKSDSLLQCLRFSAQAPGWLLRLLNDIRRVEDAAEGARLPRGQHWITRKGYERERRGGRNVAATDFHFGQAAATQRHERLARVEKEAAALPGQLKSLATRLASIEQTLSGFDAAKALADRAAEFDEAQSALPQLTVQREAAAARSQRIDGELKSHQSVLLGAVAEQAKTEAELKPLKDAVPELERRYTQSREEHGRRIEAIRQCWHGKPGTWRSKPGREEALARYRTVAEAERELSRLHARLKEETFVRDAQVVDRRDKLKLDHDQLAGRIEQQDAQLERARSTTERARAQYINVLKATLRRYARNLSTLGALAGIAVEVGYPNLANDDLSLAQAALLVQFDFDQKGLIGLNDGEASGGQQVMKSMILLVGLMMEDEGAGGGFVFIDEPFAHLDIFNIDRVGAFLQATRAQYIVTTPNTHNVNVFKPSNLTLLTQKRRPGEAFAQPVAFLRRAQAKA